MSIFTTRARSFAFAALLAMSGAAAAETTVLRLSDLFPASYPFGQLTTQFAQDVKARTGGKVEVQVFPSGTLTTPAQCFEGVLQGLSDMCQAVLAYTPGRFPVMESVDLPGYPISGRLTTRVANEIYRKFTPKELSQVHVLYVHAHPPGSILTASRPVRKLEDLKGMRIRSTGLSARILTALGASPVSMPITQAYDPLKRGVVDGTDGTFNTHRYYRFAEVTRFTTVSTDVGYVTTFAVVMNKDRWNSLPADAKAALGSVSDEYADKAGELWDKIEMEGLSYAREREHEFIRLEPSEMARWRDLVLAPLEADYVKRMEAAGLPGREILEVKKEAIRKYTSEYPPLDPNSGNK
ncbi:MAG: TRAP transporter substrate-binding protein [Burkholderiaceae bacterium]|nr:TRAP transporter substrate-binding protein [Burkholderiaceae bacterium]